MFLRIKDHMYLFLYQLIFDQSYLQTFFSAKLKTICALQIHTGNTKTMF
jgi:hypothetical protein